jgi:hypothetical protein
MLTPHSIIHGDACFAYFNKIWGIPEDASRCHMVLVGEAFEHVNHELHRGIVVIQRQQAVEAWPLGSAAWSG